MEESVGFSGSKWSVVRILKSMGFRYKNAVTEDSF
jgi:hypothetical protein